MPDVNKPNSPTDNSWPRLVGAAWLPVIKYASHMAYGEANSKAIAHVYLKISWTLKSAIKINNILKQDSQIKFVTVFDQIFDCLWNRHGIVLYVIMTLFYMLGMTLFYVLI